MEFTIKSSVGESAKNAPQDVKVVQVLLNNILTAGLLSPWPSLATDGVCGPKTKKMIKEFQRRLGGQPIPDGRIDKNGPTINKLRAFTKNLPAHRSIGSFNASTLAIVESITKHRAPGLLMEISVGAQGNTPIKGKDLSKASKQEFVNIVYELAMGEQNKHGYPASVTTAQAVLETGYGKRIPVDGKTGQYSFNLFGIKGSGPAGSVYCGTHEELPGKKRIQIKDHFRAYYSFEQSVEGRSEFLQRNPRYRSILTKTEAKDWCYGLVSAGYATGSQYAESLLGVIKMWNLK